MRSRRRRPGWAFIVPFALLLAAVLCIPAAASGTGFADVPEDHWAAAQIASLSEAGIVQGRPDGTFAPEDTVSRAEFLTMVARVLDEEPLPDAAEGERWWQPAYDYAAAQGLVDEATLPAEAALLESGITRYEVAELLYDSCALVLEDTSGVAETEAPADVSQDHVAAVSASIRMGLLTGYPDGNFGGGRTLTRAEAAVILCRLEVRATLPEGFAYVTSWDTHWLLQSAAAEGTELRLVDIVTGETLQTISLEMDLPLPDRAALGLDEDADEAQWQEDLLAYLSATDGLLTLTAQQDDLVCGEAGLYRYENGTLIQLYDSGVCAVTADGDGLLLVTRPRGGRVTYTSGGMPVACGDMVVRLDAEWNAEVLLDSDPSLGLCLTDVFHGEDGDLYVTSGEVWGMADLHTYLYRVEAGRLVACATQGGAGYSERTETETAEEQARLDAVYAVQDAA